MWRELEGATWQRPSTPGGRTQVEWWAERLSVCERLCGGGLAPPTQEVVVMSWCAFWQYYWWTSGGRSKFLGEWGLRNRMVLLWGPSLLAQLPGAHSWPHPCSGMRVVGYFLPHGCLSCGLQVICAPPPISLVLHLKSVWNWNILCFLSHQLWCVLTPLATSSHYAATCRQQRLPCMT